MIYDFRYPRSAYVRKFRRAEEHLKAVKREIARYERSSPYIAVRDRDTDPNPRVWMYRAELANKPSPDLPLMIGDFVHNLRSSLDHLQAALVPASRKRKAKFMILREDPWQIDKETGSYIDRLADDRSSWRAAMEGIDPVAETYIRRLQPYSESSYDPERHVLARLHALDNADKHFELAPTATGIGNPVCTLTDGDFTLTNLSMQAETIATGGVIADWKIRPRDLKTVTDNQDLIELILAKLAGGDAEVDVELTGTPQIAIKIAEIKGKQLPIPQGLENHLQMVREFVIVPMEEFVLPHGRVVR